MNEQIRISNIIMDGDIFDVIVCEALRLQQEKPGTPMTLIANQAIGRVASETHGVRTDAFDRQSLRDAIIDCMLNQKNVI